MFHLRMSRADRRLWAETRTLADLGQLTARWLEGDIKSRPGYQPGYGPDSETTPLIPTLAALNRAGFLTDSSQPGEIGPGFDGAHWEQRAAVDGFVADERLLGRLTRAARSVDAGVLVDDRRGVVVTTRGGEHYTGFGNRVPRSHLRLCWGEVGRDAYDEVVRARHVAIFAYEYGERGNRLWPALASAIR